LDYFGQAVNIAARVQALAEADEPVFEADGVRRVFADNGYQEETVWCRSKESGNQPPFINSESNQPYETKEKQ